MKLFEVEIYGGKYSVEYKELDCQGETFLDRGIIYLNKDYPLEHQKTTLIHEVLHVAFEARWQYQVDAVAQIIDKDLKEHLIVDPIACSLYDILKANKELRDWLWS